MNTREFSFKLISRMSTKYKKLCFCVIKISAWFYLKVLIGIKLCLSLNEKWIVMYMFKWVV